MSKNKGGYNGGSSIEYAYTDASEYARQKNRRMYKNMKNRKKSLLELEAEEFYRKKKEESNAND